MLRPRIRSMTPDDVPAATAALLQADFGDRGSWLSFATDHRECRTLLAETDGEIVGTAVGTASGAVGWLATIWVAPGLRRRGLGRELTDAVIDALAATGCRTFVLVATDAGRRLYEAMGFELQAGYQVLEAPMGPPDAEADAAVRPFRDDDLGAILALDQVATGEDRRHVIEPFATPATARVLEVSGAVRGYVIRAPWGGGATVAAEAADAIRLLDARRRAGGPSGRVRAGLLDSNVDGLALLEMHGYRRIWSAPRLVRGELIHWHPDWIWGQFNHAIG